MTRNEIRMSKAKRLRNALIVILCILATVVLAVYVGKKADESYRESFNEGAFFGLLTTSADANWFAQTIKMKEYVSYQEAVLRMLADYSEETVNEVLEEAADLFKREYILEKEFKEISSYKGFKDGYMVLSSMGVMSMAFHLEEITEEEYDMLTEEMEKIVENPNHKDAREFLNHFMELIDISKAFNAIGLPEEGAATSRSF